MSAVLRCRAGAVPAIVLLLCSPFLTSCGSILAGAAAPSAGRASPNGALLGYVNPLIGTAGDGNVFPGAAAPFGMVQWSPDTSAGGLSRPGGYAYGDRIITGFSLNHLSGPGCVAFGNVPIMPTLRPFAAAPQPNGSPYSDRFLHADEHASPGTYDVRLASGIGVHLNAAARSGLGAFTFPAGSSGTVVVNAGGGAGGRLNTDGALDARIAVLGNHEIAGWARAGHFCNLGNRYTVYFDGVFEQPFARVTVWRGGVVQRGARAASGPRSGAALTFAPARTVRLKIALSYVSVANARKNLAAEQPGWNDAAARASARQRWASVLGRIRVSGGSTDERRVFYTALYHSCLHPNIFSDVDGRYVGFDGRIHTAAHRVQYANFSGWDIYRSQIQLLAWLMPNETSDMMASLLDDARALGRLPKWPVANAETGEMNGDSADPILANAFAFGARRFDAEMALRSMVLGATRTAPGRGGYLERPGLAPYLALGYIPGYNPPELHPYGAAATTLEYNIDDAAIAQLAHALGKTAIERTFSRRSHSWRLLFNPALGLIEPRMDGGSFPGGFSPTSLDGYVEGNALQYTWMVPHDLPALVSRLGGTARVVRRLDPLFMRLNGGPTDPYDWAGNEPGFTLPWVYDFAGAPWRTQAVVRWIMGNRYTTTVGGLPGNDDLGALSSWYVWAALGLYPEVPGVAGWALTTPLFSRAEVSSENGHRLTIEAGGAGSYIQAARLDGAPYRRAWLPLSALRRSSVLVFSLGRSPNRRWGI